MKISNFNSTDQGDYCCKGIYDVVMSDGVKDKYPEQGVIVLKTLTDKEEITYTRERECPFCGREFEVEQ